MINTSLNNNTSNITKNLSERDQELFYREIPSLLKKKDASIEHLFLCIEIRNHNVNCSI